MDQYIPKDFVKIVKEDRRNGGVEKTLTLKVIEGFQKGEKQVDTVVKCRDVAARHDNSRGQRLVLKSHLSKLNVVNT